MSPNDAMRIKNPILVPKDRCQVDYEVKTVRELHHFSLDVSKLYVVYRTRNYNYSEDPFS